MKKKKKQKKEEKKEKTGFLGRQFKIFFLFLGILVIISLYQSYNRSKSSKSENYINFFENFPSISLDDSTKPKFDDSSFKEMIQNQFSVVNRHIKSIIDSQFEDSRKKLSVEVNQQLNEINAKLTKFSIGATNAVSK